MTRVELFEDIRRDHRLEGLSIRALGQQVQGPQAAGPPSTGVGRATTEEGAGPGLSSDGPCTKPPSANGSSPTRRCRR